MLGGRFVPTSVIDSMYVADGKTPSELHAVELYETASTLGMAAQIQIWRASAEEVEETVKRATVKQNALHSEQHPS